MAKYRIDFALGDRVYYYGHQATIVAVNEKAHPDERYTIRIVTKSGTAYRKGDKFTTSGNHLSRTKPVKKRSVKQFVKIG